jgi:hypothetical protein
MLSGATLEATYCTSLLTMQAILRIRLHRIAKVYIIFFLEHAGGLRISILRRKNPVTNTKGFKPPHTQTHTGPSATKKKHPKTKETYQSNWRAAGREDEKFLEPQPTPTKTDHP